MKISYRMSYGPDGTVYDQNISMSLYEASQLNDEFIREIESGMPNKKQYVYTSGCEFWMKPLIDNPNSQKWNHAHYIYLNNTQLRFIKTLINNNRILDRNTRIVIK